MSVSAGKQAQEGEGRAKDWRKRLREREKVEKERKNAGRLVIKE